MAGYVAGMSIDEQTLFLAAKKKSVDVLKSSLEKGARAGLRDADGKTPLHVFAEEPLPFGLLSLDGSADPALAAIDLLVAAGCPLDVRSGSGATALATAAMAGSFSIVKALHELGASLDDAMHYVAARTRCAKMIPFLASLGADPEAINAEGISVLDAALRCWGGPIPDMVAAIESEIIRAHSSKLVNVEGPLRPARRI